MERDLVQAFRAAKDALNLAKEQESLAQAEFTKAESALIEHLEANQANATAHYEGLGYVKVQKPRLYANYKQEDLPALIEALKALQRDDLVKLTVSPQSLSSFTAERIEQGQSIPPQVSYYLKPQLRIYE